MTAPLFSPAIVITLTLPSSSSDDFQKASLPLGLASVPFLGFSASLTYDPRKGLGFPTVVLSCITVFFSASGGIIFDLRSPSSFSCEGGSVNGEGGETVGLVCGD
uniref:Uncharacterized protein n=1 Tax=Opuntia streptacantha TaxID=393608 RepID=A0A7C8YIZ6_OPUST